MNSIKFPAFGESDYSDNTAGGSRVYVIRGVGEQSFSDYESLLLSSGYEKREDRRDGLHLYAAFRGDGAIYMNYYSAIGELYIVTEEDLSYFSYSDASADLGLPTLVTQLELEDFGMCYVIRLSDGRFILIDGGQGFAPEQKRLLSCLREQSPLGVPTVAAWILTHPHSDHFNGFARFCENYLDDIFIEKVFYNFPDKNDTEHYPLLSSADSRFEYDDSATAYIPKMEEQIRRSGAAVYTPHTGQTYRIGEACCEIIASMDDTVHVTDNINATSTVIRMELRDQVILWAADAGCGYIRLAEKHGDRLKADILQVPHHGFGCGGADAEIAAYKLIAPRVCFMPVSDYNAYTVFCTYKAGARYLMTEANIDELITGTPTRTIILPYTPAQSAKSELRRKYLSGLDDCGSTAWIFTDLHTSVPSDFEFTILNTTNSTVTVWIELFFEDPKQKIRSIKAKVNPTSLKRLSIVGDEVDPDALHFNWLSLKAQGIPENVPFAVRFKSSAPTVISHPNHSASYRSQNR